ncbi:MAG TPA: chromate resistance protein ChrB domain-containing protein [Bryobacteraceae bacterium]|jgi:hypothetical protein
MQWLLLLHQIPPEPPYFRAKILRRIKQIGALSLKKSAYLLPSNEEAVEDFQWLLNEILSEGGEGWIFQVEAVAGLTDDVLRESFRELRASDYRDLAAEAHALAETEPGRRKLKRRYEEIVRIDFFGAPGREEIERIMNKTDKAPSARAGLAEFRGRSWVTRRGIKIDRTASAWLIRRFLDPDARFVFVEPSVYTHRDGELRFDMFEGEFTHQGDLCTFEVLLDRAGLDDPGLRAIAEIVHDLDLKEARYDRPETAGVKSMIEGFTRRYTEDPARLEAGLVLFDSLYAALSLGTA